MLNILGKFRNTARIQFTGKDLKTWYAKFGKDKIYICSVIHYIFKEQTALSGYYPNSNDVINDMRELVPIRFKKPVSWSMTIDNNLKSKYISGKPGRPANGFRCRTNLLNCIPDDHIFTWVLVKD